MADDDLLASMYDDEASTAPTAPIARTDPWIRKIRVGIIEYEVPTVDYVRHLERTVMQQAAVLDQQHRALIRLESMLMGTRRMAHQAAGELRSEVSRKVDRS